MKLWDELVWRGLIKDVSSPDIEEKINNGGLTFYIGTDPTADSMHIGHFCSFSIAKRLKDGGHNPILLVGGATGLIGDPRPSTERPIISYEDVKKNVDGLTKQVKKLYGFEVVNNYDWSKDINFIDFLRDYGKYFGVNYMLDKDIIKRRLEDGITYTEFSYMIMQALDFLWLMENKGVTLQVAGSDQWGNITAGIELIRRKAGKEVFGFTGPLIADSKGEKFGKTAGNALWLDKNQTSSYEMYQFLINLEDEMIIEYLKKLSFLTPDEIMEIEKKHKETPEQRVAHKALAKNVITFLHSEEDYNKAVEISEKLFAGDLKSVTAKDIRIGLSDVPTFEIKEEQTLLDMLVNNEICTSRREAREFLTSNTISINGEIVTDENLIINKDIAIDNELVVVRRGKKKYFVGIIK